MSPTLKVIEGQIIGTKKVEPDERERDGWIVAISTGDAFFLDAKYGRIPVEGQLARVWVEKSAGEVDVVGVSIDRKEVFFDRVKRLIVPGAGPVPGAES